jgi:hypothetical protein
MTDTRYAVEYAREDGQGKPTAYTGGDGKGLTLVMADRFLENVLARAKKVTGYTHKGRVVPIADVTPGIRTVGPLVR